MYNYLLFWTCVLGLCLGSFYNVVILRSLSNESIIFPPSKCPKCGNKLFWWHNIPIISYILLKGKCYFCKEKISIQYPIIEFVTMILFAGAYIKFGITFKTLFAMFWLSCLLIMTVTDLKEKLVDCNIAIAMAVSGVIYNGIIFGWRGVLYSVLGLLAGALILEAIARLGYIMAKTRAMGEADTYVAGALGAIFGIQTIVYVLVIGLFASMIFVVPMFLYNRYKSNDKITCVWALSFILSIILFKTSFENWIMFAFLVLTGGFFAYSVMKGIRTSENRNYLPYVPALACGALWGLFL